MSKIEWKHDGRRITLPIAIYPSFHSPNPMESMVVQALVDTGATGTGIRQDVVDKLELPIKGFRRVGTANGDVKSTEHLIRIGVFPGIYEANDYTPPDEMPFGLENELLA